MNVGQWPTRWAQLYPDKTCLKYGELVLSQKEFNSRVNKTAAAFQSAGVKKGDRVAALMANSNVFLELLFGLSKIGAIMVPLNFRLAGPELEFICNDSSPVSLVYSLEFLPLVEEIRGKVASLKSYVCETAGGKEGDLEFESWIAERPDDEPVPDMPVTLDDPQFIMYTSGTTGRPKGAVLTHGNTQWNAINSVHMYSMATEDISLISAPLFHIGGLSAAATPSMYVGSPLIIQRFFDPAGIISLIRDEKVTFMFGIPVMFLFMSQIPEFETADFSSMKFFIAGGSPCPKPLIETYKAKNVTFAQGYGMTETAPALTALKPEDAIRKLGSCGKPVFHTLVKVVNLEGREMPVGQIGEVIVNGPNVIREYWNRPDATAATIVDGWLHTGDMGYFDDEGYLYLVDRRKDMYISGGENVYPAEVEDVLMGFEKVADVGVIGIPDEKWGEVGLAAIVPAPGAEVNEDEVIEFCKGKLAKYKIPKKIVTIDALPRTLTGKILKKDLRARFGEQNDL